MAAILPALSIDADPKLSRHFLPYQVVWILDDSRMMLAEKSVRIGWTYADAMRNVRLRLRNKNRDYLFATKDQASAVEYMATCKKFCEIYSLTKTILSHGEDSVKVNGKGAAGEDVVEEVKFGYIKFDTGSRIIAFSSNPYAMAVFGGDVGLDEFAKHPAAEKLWETAQGRIAWGYSIGAWSAHDGTDTLFHQFGREAAAGKGGWSHYRVTMEDAVGMGLVEKINEVRGSEFTREDFIEDCKKVARLPEIYEQAYNCNPSGSASSIVPWAVIGQCRRDYTIERWHLEAGQVRELFGTFSDATRGEREAAIRRAIRGAFGELFAEPAHRRLGFDVAASGEGDLASIWIDEKEGRCLRLAALFTCRTDDWHFLQNALWTFMGLGALTGAGDETGLGRQICWETAHKFPGRFEPVNFRSRKHAMGLELMNRLSVAEKVIPSGEDDIAQDLFSLKKTFSGGRWIFSEGRNLLNPASHCDMAWAAALADEADAGSAGGAFDMEAVLGMVVGTRGASAAAGRRTARFVPTRL